MIGINRNPTPRELRLFCALWLPLFGLVLGSILRWRLRVPEAAAWLWGTTAFSSLVGLGSLRVARALFVGLSMLTYPIGFCVSHLILAVLFFAVLTPIALAMRLFRRDVLQFQRPVAKSGPTNWVARRGTADMRQHFRQF